MERNALQKLIAWNHNKRRKPLIVWGARQVGKTWLMKEFGKEEYKDTLYINFDSNPRIITFILTAKLKTKFVIFVPIPQMQEKSLNICPFLKANK